MKNLRILYAGPGNQRLRPGDVFEAANLLAAGFSVNDLIKRGDVEQTDAAATVHFDVGTDLLAEAEDALQAEANAKADADAAAAAKAAATVQAAGEQAGAVAEGTGAEDVALAAGATEPAGAAQ